MTATSMAPSSVLSAFAVSSFSTTATLAIAVSASAPVGVYDIFLTNPSGQFEPITAAVEVIAPTPVVTAVSGGTGSTSGGESVTVTGTGFQSGAFVMFGGKEAVVTNFDDATALKVTTPSGSVGTVDVRVHNPDGQVALGAEAWRYADIPVVTRVFPSAGQASGGTSLVLEGSNFDEQATVLFDGSIANSVVVESSSRMLVTTPGGPLGEVTITVTNPSTDPQDVSGAFSYVSAADPLILGFFPISGDEAGGEELRINGQNLTATSSVRFGSASKGAVAAGVTVESSASVVAVAPKQSSGSYPIEIIFANGQGAVASASFSVSGGPGSSSRSSGGGGGCGGLADSPDFSWLFVAALFVILSRRSRSHPLSCRRAEPSS